MNRFHNAFHETDRGLLIGVCLTCAIQGSVAAIAYLCLQIPRWYALGVLTGLCSLISDLQYSHCLNSSNDWTHSQDFKYFSAHKIFIPSE
jgi:hypothetical protein